jgi:hypothetical protein
VRDHKAYVLDGVIQSGRFAGYRLSGWVSRPVDPCHADSFTGRFDFLAP